jgi:predicted nucleotidyltransferase
MKTINDLRHYLNISFPDAHIYLFGSRARQTHVSGSDIDIAIESSEPLGQRLSMARFEIEESLLPFKVDLVDLSRVPKLSDAVHREGIRWH